MAQCTAEEMSSNTPSCATAVLGYLSAVTHSSHTTRLHHSLWPWFMAKERSSAVTALLFPHCRGVPFQRAW